jgi:alkylated DNA repair dioxygenase AlkB
MDLFNTPPAQNILPYDGVTIYYGKVFNQDEADLYLDVLLRNVAWKNDELVMFGKHIITKRKVAWYADGDYAYTYSNTTKRAMEWTPELLALKNKTKDITLRTFNSCLLNLYHTGKESMSWHSDDEKELSPNGAIASLSFGAERKFSLRHKITGHTVSVLLENGSLLLMKDTTQTHWLHSLPKSSRVQTPRVNLTFRTFLL